MGLIPLHNRAGDVEKYAWVDDADDTRVAAMGQWHWHAEGFVRKAGNVQRVRLDRYLMRVKDIRARVIHIDGNPLNNTRANLRVVMPDVPQIGRTGRSGVAGIVWSTRRKRWIVRGRYRDKGFHLGGFTDLEEAKSALNAWKESYDQDQEPADG